MLALFLSVIALIFLLLMLRCNFHIVYQDDFKAAFHILCFRFPVYPKKKKRVKYAPPKKKQKKKPATVPNPSPKQSPTDTVAFLRHFLKTLLTKSFGYLRVRVSRICIQVGSDDPAKTAILFGAVNTAVIGLLETLDLFGKFGGKRNAVLSVKPDYLAKETKWDIHIVLSLRVWQMLAILFKTFLSSLKNN